MSESEREVLRSGADYQFGAGSGEALFPESDSLTVTHTSSGRPRQVLVGDERLGTYTRDGRYTLGIAGGRRLHEAFAPPFYRVVVGDESDPFVRDGRNAFAKFVDRADASIRPGDEVLVVHEDGDFLAVGRAELSGPAVCDFETGVAVTVREGVGAGPTEGEEK